jgi:hypothetical protein
LNPHFRNRRNPKDCGGCENTRSAHKATGFMGRHYIYQNPPEKLQQGNAKNWRFPPASGHVQNTEFLAKIV